MICYLALTNFKKLVMNCKLLVNLNSSGLNKIDLNLLNTIKIEFLKDILEIINRLLS
jgi:hypothetical protein